MVRTPLIGLTGGIATGKSTVAAMLKARGAHTIDADILARQVAQPGSGVLALVAERFGSAIVTPAGELDRRALAQIVFDDDHARSDLNAIVHPAVAVALEEAIEEAHNCHPILIVVEVPLLFEVGWENRFDGSLLVDVDASTQLQRLMARDRITRAEAMARRVGQMPARRKRSQATWILKNDHSLAETAAQVTRLWPELRTCAKR